MIGRVLDELGTGFDVQFQHNPGLVVLNRLGCEMKMCGDLFGGLPLCKKTENLALPRL